jgi:hypothetical protein
MSSSCIRLFREFRCSWVVLVALPPTAYQQVCLDIDWAAPDAEKDDGISYQWFKLFQEGLMPSFGMFTVSLPSPQLL